MIFFSTNTSQNLSLIKKTPIRYLGSIGTITKSNRKIGQLTKLLRRIHIWIRLEIAQDCLVIYLFGCRCKFVITAEI